MFQAFTQPWNRLVRFASVTLSTAGAVPPPQARSVTANSVAVIGRRMGPPMWCAPLRSSRIEGPARARGLVLTPFRSPTSVGPMTTPPPPRPSVGRSSFAIAMKDYTFIRPGIAVSISAVTLIVALILGLTLVTSLQRAAVTVRTGATALQTLHGASAKLEVWRQMATSADPAYK